MQFFHVFVVILFSVSYRVRTVYSVVSSSSGHLVVSRSLVKTADIAFTAIFKPVFRLSPRSAICVITDPENSLESAKHAGKDGPLSVSLNLWAAKHAGKDRLLHIPKPVGFSSPRVFIVHAGNINHQRRPTWHQPRSPYRLFPVDARKVCHFNCVRK